MSENKRAAFWSGVMLIVLFACTATLFAGFEWVKALRLSPLIVGILLGMLYANTLRSQVGLRVSISAPSRSCAPVLCSMVFRLPSAM